MLLVRSPQCFVGVGVKGVVGVGWGGTDMDGQELGKVSGVDRVRKHLGKVPGVDRVRKHLGKRLQGPCFQCTVKFIFEWTLFLTMLHCSSGELSPWYIRLTVPEDGQQ